MIRGSTFFARVVLGNRGMESRDRITVPAGTYAALSVYQHEDNGDYATFWLTPGVGVIMLSGKTELFGGDRLVFEWKLKSFHPSEK
jgi:hypothetical protein